MADFTPPDRFNALPGGTANGPHYRWQIVPFSADIADTDTAEIELEGEPILDANGLPVTVGLPAGLALSLDGRTMTLTADAAVGTWEGSILILLKK